MLMTKTLQLLASILENFVEIIHLEKSNINSFSLLEKLKGKEAITKQARGLNVQIREHALVAL